MTVYLWTTVILGSVFMNTGAGLAVSRIITIHTSTLSDKGRLHKMRPFLAVINSMTQRGGCNSIFIWQGDVKLGTVGGVLTYYCQGKETHSCLALKYGEKKKS